MRKLILCGLVIVAVGCTRSSERGGGNERRDSFTLRGPNASSSIDQGEERMISLTVDRGQDFNQTVRLAAEAPTGIAADLDLDFVRPTDTGDVLLKITVGKDWPAGAHNVQVTATPENGKATTLDVPVNVKAKANN